MSNVAADFSAQASNAALSKAGRQSHASQKAPSGQFDDLLNAIPDAPPEPRDRGTAETPERTPPAETRTASRGERPARTDRPERPDRKTTADSQTADNPASPADETVPQDAAPAKTDTAANGTKPAGEKTTAKADEADSQADDSQTSDTSAVTQAATDALVPQAVVIDPATAALAAEPVVDGEAAIPAGTRKAETAIAAVTAANTATTAKVGEQQAAALADQTTGLTADDADVLSALAAKAQQGLKNAEGDKTGKKAATDKPAQAAKPAGETAAPAMTGVPAQAADSQGDTAGAKPVHSELAKVAVEHQRGQSDAGAKPAADQAPAAAAGANAAAVKAPDTFATHMLTASANTIHAAAASKTETGPSQSSGGDKPVAIANVAVEISAKISSGKNQFDIRLDPEELGKIHVKVNVDRDGNITTHMVADRPDTLDLLRRDTQGLERALQDAGLKTSDNSLQFSLRDQNANQQQNRDDGQASRLPADDDLTTTVTTTVIARDYGRYGLKPSGLDIRV